MIPSVSHVLMKVLIHALMYWFTYWWTYWSALTRPQVQQTVSPWRRWTLRAATAPCRSLKRFLPAANAATNTCRYREWCHHCTTYQYPYNIYQCSKSESQTKEHHIDEAADFSVTQASSEETECVWIKLDFCLLQFVCQANIKDQYQRSLTCSGACWEMTSLLEDELS